MGLREALRKFIIHPVSPDPVEQQIAKIPENLRKIAIFGPEGSREVDDAIILIAEEFGQAVAESVHEMRAIQEQAETGAWENKNRQKNKPL